MALEQIGQKLKTARESQGLTLVQVYERTKIPLHHLQSLDQGVIDDLPEPVYVAGFIKRYGDTVGLNGQALSEEYRRLAAEDKGGNGNAGGFGRGGNVGVQPVIIPAPYMNKTRIESGAPSLMKTLVFPSLFAILFLGMLGVLLTYHNQNNSEQPDPSILSHANAKFNNVQATAANVPPVAAVPTAPATSESQISLIAARHVWVEVKSMGSGESLYTGFLEAGDRRDFKDPQGIRVHAGNGGSVTIEADGKSEALGAPGKISEKTFMAKNATATAMPALGPDGKPVAGTGSILGSASSTTAVKPVRKPVRKATGTDTATAPARHKTYRSIEDLPSRRYVPGEGTGGTRSIDVPYRYTEGRLDTD